MKYRITKISENRRFPGVIYAQLINAETNELMISATLQYIFDVIKERHYSVVNVEQDKFGNFTVVS